MTTNTREETKERVEHLTRKIDALTESIRQWALMAQTEYIEFAPDTARKATMIALTECSLLKSAIEDISHAIK